MTQEKHGRKLTTSLLNSLAKIILAVLPNARYLDQFQMNKLASFTPILTVPISKTLFRARSNREALDNLEILDIRHDQTPRGKCSLRCAA